MSHANLARSAGPGRPAMPGPSKGWSGMAPHRGDVTTVRAASSVRLQATKHIERLQAHAPSHRMAGAAPVPFVVPGGGRA